MKKTSKKIHQDTPGFELSTPVGIQTLHHPQDSNSPPLFTLVFLSQFLPIDKYYDIWLKDYNFLKKSRKGGKLMFFSIIFILDGFGTVLIRIVLISRKNVNKVNYIFSC